MAMTPAQRHAKHKLTAHGRASVLLGHARRRAQQKGGVCSVTVEHIASVIGLGKCELTGLPFDLSPPTDTLRNPYSPSIDRIDPQCPDYTPGNTRIVLSWVNMALSDYGLDVSLPIVRALAGVAVEPS